MIGIGNLALASFPDADRQLRRALRRPKLEAPGQRTSLLPRALIDVITLILGDLAQPKLRTAELFRLVETVSGELRSDFTRSGRFWR